MRVARLCLIASLFIGGAVPLSAGEVGAAPATAATVARTHAQHGHDQWRGGEGDRGHTWAAYQRDARRINAYVRAVALSRLARCASEPHCAVRLASFFHAAPYGLVDRVVACESGYRPDAANPSSSAGGLGQWLSGSWASYAPRYGMGGRSRFETWPAAWVTAGVIADGGISNWDASRHCWS